MKVYSKADVIFVLAGREIRKHYALQLYRENYSPRLLVSVARYEVRPFSQVPWPKRIDLLGVAASSHPPERHFFVCFMGELVTIDKIALGRWGTLSEIRALATWLEAHDDVRRVIMVSSYSHLARVRLCCRQLLQPAIEWELVPVPPTFASAASGASPEAEQTSTFEPKELVKLLCYRLAFLFAPKKMARLGV